METKRIVFLDYLRAISIFMVLVAHVCEFYYGAILNPDPANEADRWWAIIVDSACRASVPLFVITSAYLLLPLKEGSTFPFFKRRLVRVFIPFLIWSFLYTVLPMAWGDFGWERSKELMTEWLTNFPYNAGHLWYVYMLIGVYLFMPILSPWLRKVGKREELFFLGLWFLSTFWLYLKALVPSGYIYGEAVWNNFHILYYNAGYIGYLLMAHYIRTYIHWSTKKTLAICIPLFLIGLGVTVYLLNEMSLGNKGLYMVELPWQFCTPNVALMTFALFMLFKLIRLDKGWVYKGTYSLSRMSYGVYLIHIFLLGILYHLLSPHMETGATIFVVGILTYAASYIVVRLLSCLPYGKYLVG